MILPGLLPDSFRPRMLLRLLSWGLLALPLLGGCADAERSVRLSGQTMGTTYRVEVVGEDQSLDQEQLRALCEDRLQTINLQMSGWLPDSEISRFNVSQMGEWFPVSREVVEVVALAREISELTGGAFDITVGALVEGWRFGPNGAVNGEDAHAPSPEEKALIQENLGYRRLEYRWQPPALRKQAPFVVDLSAIAKGYAVDVLAMALKTLGASNFLVEIGGEVRVGGRNSKGRLWTIGIERPETLAYGHPYRALAMTDMAVATSGDYRNFQIVDDQVRSHLVDPATGDALLQKSASVTIVSESAARADALATAFSVLGYDRALPLAEDSGVAALFLQKRDAGFFEASSAAFAQVMELMDD